MNAAVLNYSRLMSAVMAAEYAASWLCTRGLQADLHVLGCNIWLPMKTKLQFNSASSTCLGAYGMLKERLFLRVHRVSQMQAPGHSLNTHARQTRLTSTQGRALRSSCRSSPLQLRGGCIQCCHCPTRTSAGPYVEQFNKQTPRRTPLQLETLKGKLSCKCTQLVACKPNAHHR